MLSSSRVWVLSSVLLAAPAFLLSSPADAAETKPSVEQMQKNIAKQEALIKNQQKILADQQKEIADQRAKLEALIKKVEAKPESATEKKVAGDPKATTLGQDQIAPLGTLTQTSEQEMKQASGAGKPAEAAPAPEAAPRTAVATSITAPPKEEKRPEIAVLPDVGGVLTPKGTLMYENSLEYVNTTNNVFTFSGVQVAEVVFIGVTNASTAKRQVIQDSNRLRLGLLNNLEADIRVPYIYRSDTTSETNTSTNVTERRRIEGDGIGDIDGGLSYQINRGQEGWPFFVANMRYKANNADGPFDVPYDADSIATRLPIGTGFHSVEGSLTTIKVTDPAVLFTNLGYVHNFSDSIDKTFGNTRILEVEPGAAINASAGMGFSINPETSFTLGYKHSYVFPTTQHNQNVSTGAYTSNESDSASVGALLVGASYRFSPITSLNMNVEVGATREAPDVRVGLRIPIRLGTLF